ncbi:hypothetical protein FFJ24_021300 [Pedobacter sp. KBS0701]|uniref:hypothetical protein n=1 Tax=Pedobacter sp. KBS0701 TaxID=2578106 RepID=UPI00110E1403|nr:hypothetical protein [Pedobacter sp. KBS0701]QDW27225.1 hypothetical protein FFJ24_021300 [Pedobacter sp. KBS0701]
MIYQEKFDLNTTSAEYFSQQIDILIIGLRDDRSRDERCNHVRNSLKQFKGSIFYLGTNETAESFEYEVKDENNSLLDKQNGLTLIPGLKKFLANQSISTSSVCIDITCLSQPILFLLVKIFLSEIKPKRLFASYTEPKKYLKVNKVLTDDEEFELYDGIVGCNYSVPGFSKINRNDNEMLVAPFGFERQRLISIYENVEPKGGLIPILGFPSFVPGWDLTALYMNYKVLSDAESEQKIKLCDASCPFGIYELLKLINSIYSQDFRLLLAPLGTRPHALGMAIFATKYKDCHLIYDFPIEKNFRSEKVLKSSMYHLSGFID